MTTDEAAAYAADQWVKGAKQRQIGAVIGKSGSQVCQAIAAFTLRFAPEARRDVTHYADGQVAWAQGAKRRVWAALAVNEYRKRGGKLPAKQALPVSAGNPLHWPIEALGLPTRIRRTLVENERCQTVGDVTKFTERELLRMQNLGAVTVDEVKRMLAQHGLKLAPDPHFQPPPVSAVNARLSRIETALVELQAIVRSVRSYEQADQIADRLRTAAVEWSDARLGCLQNGTDGSEQRHRLVLAEAELERIVRLVGCLGGAPQ